MVRGGAAAAAGGEGGGEGGEGSVPCMCMEEEVGVDTVGDCQADALYSSNRSPIIPSLSGVCIVLIEANEGPWL